MNTRRNFLKMAAALPFISFFFPRAEKTEAQVPAAVPELNLNSPAIKLSYLELLTFQMLREMEVDKRWNVMGNYALPHQRVYPFAIPSLKIGFMIYIKDQANESNRINNNAYADEFFYKRYGWVTIHLNEWMLTQDKDDTMKRISSVIDMQTSEFSLYYTCTRQ